MWTYIQPSAVAVLFAVTSFFAPQRAAADGNEPDDQSQETARIEQEFADKVEKYNELLKRWQFDEALMLGKEARLLQPENPMSELMVLKAKFAKQEAVNRLSMRFNATVIADVPENLDGSKAIEDTLGIADRTIYRLASGKDEDTGDSRRLLYASLERRIEMVHQICRLTDAQKRKLRLAGRGDSKRFLDRIQAFRPKIEQSHAADDDDLGHQGICGIVRAFDEDAFRPARRLGLFEEGSLFSKVLNTSLTEGQAAAWEASTTCRQEARE